MTLAAFALWLVPLVAGQGPSRPQCGAWQECRRLALEAADRREYERFHDLAWRTVQTGPPRNADLMLMLARAQALSGRPHDALVMMQRLIEMGVAFDAGTDEFARTRELPGWPGVAALLEALSAASTPKPPPAAAVAMRSAAPAPASIVAAPPRPAPLAPPATVKVASLAIQPVARADVAQFSAERFSPGGLAYDAVSNRFVIGDAQTRRLMVVGVGGRQPTDMVRADSAGFEEVSAVAIDEKRGDLWVAGAAGAVHRLQLVSGRPLMIYRTAPSAGVVQLVDLAVAPSGTVVGLDGAGHRVLVLGRGAREWRVSKPLGIHAVTSVTLEDEDTAFVSHAGGVARLDLRTYAMTEVTAAAGIDLRGIERIRAHGRTLIAVQRVDRAWRVLRLSLQPSGRRVAGAVVIDEPGPAGASRPFVTVTGDDLYYVSASAMPADEAAPYLVRRLSLR